MSDVTKLVDLKIRAKNETQQGVQEAKRSVLQGLKDIEHEQRMSGERSLEKALRGAGALALVDLAARAVDHLAKETNEHLERFISGNESAAEAFSQVWSQSISQIPVIGTFANMARSVTALAGTMVSSLEESWLGWSHEEAQQSIANADNYAAQTQRKIEANEKFTDSLKGIIDAEAEAAASENERKLMEADRRAEQKGEAERKVLEAEINNPNLGNAERQAAADRLDQLDEETEKLKKIYREKELKEIRAHETAVAQEKYRADVKQFEAEESREHEHASAMADIQAETAANRLRAMGREVEAEALLKERAFQRELERSKEKEAAAINANEDRVSKRGGLDTNADVDERTRIRADAAAEREALAKSHEAAAAEAAAQAAKKQADEKIDGERKVRDLHMETLKLEADAGNVLAKKEIERLEIQTRYADKANEITKILADQKNLTAEQRKQLTDDLGNLDAAKDRALGRVGAEDNKGNEHGANSADVKGGAYYRETFSVGNPQLEEARKTNQLLTDSKNAFNTMFNWMQQNLNLASADLGSD